MEFVEALFAEGAVADVDGKVLIEASEAFVVLAVGGDHEEFVGDPLVDVGVHEFGLVVMETDKEHSLSLEGGVAHVHPEPLRDIFPLFIGVLVVVPVIAVHSVGDEGEASVGRVEEQVE